MINYAYPFLAIMLISVLSYSKKGLGILVENIVLREKAITDDLTKLYTYKFFVHKLEAEIKKVMQENTELSLVMYDIDHFKKINDTYGHEIGNKVLVAISKVFNKNTRGKDVVARYGGEEFCVILPGASDEIAVKQTERILKGIKALTIMDHEKNIAIKVTISAGIVSTGRYLTENVSSFIAAADQALYKSKHLGRDKVTVFKNEDQ